MHDLWQALLIGYVFSVLIEAPVLAVGLSARHSLPRRLFAGLWLTACTYPILVLVFPAIFDPDTERAAYLLLGEIFAPVAECLLFYVAFDREEGTKTSEIVRDMVVIVVANVLSFVAGEWLRQNEEWARWWF